MSFARLNRHQTLFKKSFNDLLVHCLGLVHGFNTWPNDLGCEALNFAREKMMLKGVSGQNSERSTAVWPAPCEGGACRKGAEALTSLRGCHRSRVV